MACGRSTAHSVGADAHIGPAEQTVFTEIFGKFVTSLRVDVGIDPYKRIRICLRIRRTFSKNHCILRADRVVRPYEFPFQCDKWIPSYCTTAARGPHCRICLFSFGDLSDSRKKIRLCADSTKNIQTFFRNFRTTAGGNQTIRMKNPAFCQHAPTRPFPQQIGVSGKNQTKSAQESEENKIRFKKAACFRNCCPLSAHAPQKLSARCAESGVKAVRQIDFRFFPHV